MDITDEQYAKIADMASDATINKLLTQPTLAAMFRGFMNTDDVLPAGPTETDPTNKHWTPFTWVRKLGAAWLKK